jgi:hypothetical protein
LTSPTFAYLQRTVTEMATGWVGLALVAALMTIAIATVVQPRAGAVGASRDRLVLAALLTGFVVPPVALWVAGQAMPIFVDRYAISSTVAVLALAVLGLDIVRQRAGRTAAVGLLAAMVGLGGLHVAALEAAPIKGENPPAVVAAHPPTSRWRRRATPGSRTTSMPRRSTRPCWRRG